MPHRSVTLMIDGTTVRVPPGTSVLEAALQYAICIPSLCHVPHLTPNGVCRLCIVEVVTGGRARVTTSCTLEAEEGMVVRAHSEPILRLRRGIAELLVAEAPNSRAIQDVAARCGVETVRYPFHNAECILCGRCVRVCGEAVQAKALGLVGRGDDRRVDFPFGRRPKACKRGLMCVHICPMTIPPCGGVMPAGKEYLCDRCRPQLTVAEQLPGLCIHCDLGRGFHCSRHAK
jgi:NADH dehydrogenase/NADH:ubiquinone oxidoreductase subunit G